MVNGPPLSYKFLYIGHGRLVILFKAMKCECVRLRKVQYILLAIIKHRSSFKIN